MSIFNKKRNSQPESFLAQVTRGIEEEKILGNSNLASLAITMESRDPHASEEFENATDSLTQCIQNSINSVAGLAKLTAAQESAALIAGVLGTSPADHFKHKMVEEGTAVSTTNQNVLSMYGASSAMNKRIAAAMEAYDNTNNRKSSIFSVVYNAQAARQDEFGEAFFPTSVLTPDQTGFMISVNLIEVLETTTRKITGEVDNFGRKNIVRAAIDHTILESNLTKLIPIYRTQSRDKFATDVGPTTVKIGSEEVQTGPLKIGTSLSLLGISQTETAMQSGLQDLTDSVDSFVKLEAIYVKLANNTNDVIKFKTLNLAFSAFNYSVQQNERKLTLNFDSRDLLVTSDTKKVDGSALAGAGTIGTNSVRLKVSMTGSINQQEANLIVNVTEFGVHTVRDSEGTELSTASGVGQSISNLFNGAQVIGYDVQANRTNSNRRERGQIIDTRVINYFYPIPILDPLSSLRPVNADTTKDSNILAGLIQTTRVKTSNNAVGALLNARMHLKDYTAANNSASDSPLMYGAACELVNAAYIESIIAVDERIDSVKSSDRAEDTTAVLINELRDAAFRLYQNSGYMAASNAIAGGEAAKPVVIIGTDQTIGRYLTLTGDTRLLGDFEFKVVTSTDGRMKGKIVMTFGQEHSFTDGNPNPLHFGTMAWKPELTIMLQTQRQGATSHEITVQPSFGHVTHLPIMGYFEVTGIEDIISNKVTINTSGGTTGATSSSTVSVAPAGNTTSVTSNVSSNTSS